MAALLRERGIAFTYHEYSGGHNYTCWRRQLPQALKAVYG
jgi:enterochelin esterase-like enzyme